MGFQVSLKTVSKLDFLRKRAGDPIERAVIVAVPAKRRTSQDTKDSDTSNYHEAVCGRINPVATTNKLSWLQSFEDTEGQPSHE